VAAIYTLVTPDKYTAMLLTSGARKAYTTAINETSLNRKIFDFRQKLQDPDSDPVPLAQELYRILFPEGLRQDLDSMHVKTIMWSIDSTLRYIPLAALHDGKDYLVKTFRQSLITPGSIPNLAEAPAREWQGVGFGVSNADPPQPSVPAELRAVFRDGSNGAGALPGTVRLNADFSKSNFENDLRRKQNSVVHIAAHFDSRPGVAANSQLLLGDGPMSLSEIESQNRLFTGVQLLTLSASNTAFMNRDEDGREVDSLGAIAQRLGAKGVIATLWSVNDSSTASLMQELYRVRQETGMPKGEALRLAQEAMLTGKLAGAKAWSHPFHWAPFILIGNWK
jgi:CHAT domain-containing protein